MKSYAALPQGYAPADAIDLVHNKKQFWIVNGLSVVLCVIMLILPFLWGRSLRDFVGEGPLPALRLRLGVALAGIFAYIALHELTHGIVMMACGARVHYGYKVVYAYAGSDAYFTRSAYIVIALAPVVLWGIVFTVLTACLPREWFWVVWLWQLVNISGAAGDFYCTCRILRAPRDTLVQDTGTAMTFYRKTN